MDRWGPAGATPLVTLPNGQEGVVDENLGTGQQGSDFPALMGNAIVEELMSILAAAGVAPNINTWNQVLTAIQTLITGSVAGYIDTAGFFYFIIQTAAGFNLTFCGGPCIVPASVSSINQILPITFNTAFVGGGCWDMGASGWGYGVQDGSDLSHCIIDCPIEQINGSGVSPRPTNATGYFICVGM